MVSGRGLDGFGSGAGGDHRDLRSFINVGVFYTWFLNGFYMASNGFLNGFGPFLHGFLMVSKWFLNGF